jgi:hypothetical protein
MIDLSISLKYGTTRTFRALFSDYLGDACCERHNSVSVRSEHPLSLLLSVLFSTGSVFRYLTCLFLLRFSQ